MAVVACRAAVCRAVWRVVRASESGEERLVGRGASIVLKVAAGGVEGVLVDASSAMRRVKVVACEVSAVEKAEKECACPMAASMQVWKYRSISSEAAGSHPANESSSGVS